MENEQLMAALPFGFTQKPNPLWYVQSVVACGGNDVWSEIKCDLCGKVCLARSTEVILLWFFTVFDYVCRNFHCSPLKICLILLRRCAAREYINCSAATLISFVAHKMLVGYWTGRNLGVLGRLVLFSLGNLLVQYI